ncbi:MAG: hypothetical protein RL757_3081 [Bacteroidota bacterium]|jgi:pyruvate carboxylase
MPHLGFENESHRRFKKLMVANRGEIAIRVLRAASELGLRTVAVFTYEDRYSLHRYKSDESYQIGKNDDPLKPYLDIEEILRVAKANQVEAIHPGYGFLSENVTFARRCREEGIAFVGPSPESMAQLGDKVAAKVVALKANVPMIPDARFDDAQQHSDQTIMETGQKIGFPLMVKAVAGGGGRGMRVVQTADKLIAAFNEASGEAKTAFGDGTVFFERFIENPKHIEVQILGDHYGNLVHLFERDCSVQRRFQKVVEIAPSITLQQTTKDKLYEYALNICKAVDYSAAGTVEFLVDKDENIYFIEVNPRIQVEHTITEEITGIDLVRSQILVTMGYPLAHPTLNIKSQSDIECQGYAIQCRITTEDPTQQFKPDYGTLIAYRSAGGFGIRLDGGSAYAGAQISPFFDSMLVKVTAWGRTFQGANDRLLRALSEFRIRGVKTNIGFLENLLHHETFREGKVTVNFIAENPSLLKLPRRQDRGTKMLQFLANVIVNGNPDVAEIDLKKQKLFRKAPPPVYSPKNASNEAVSGGYRGELLRLGATEFAKKIKAEQKILYTDTTFRDAHQSLLATRLRTRDMLNVAPNYALSHGNDLFSLEMWGGATFDVALRFLKECPWKRLELLRKEMPNVLFQMLIRGSNAVGYAAYPDNLIEKFIYESADAGIDVFRIFDSFNWVEAMKTSIKAVRKTHGIAEACICYTGDILDPKRTKFDLNFYVNMAKELEQEGAHFLCVKDMAGLLTPYAAEILIGTLKQHVNIPIHLHTHDTSSLQTATYLKAIEAGVDVVDVALSSMSGLTSQPSFNGLVAAMRGNPTRNNPIDLHSLNQYANYFETVREWYYPFEADLKAGTAEVFEHEIPGGQYSNLRPQARGLGLEEKFETIKQNYKIVNQLFGDIVKVTPSSKVVGDMALFMTANDLTAADVLKKGWTLAFPDSVKAMMRGDLGQTPGGFPKELQAMVLKGETPYTEAPNAHLAPVDFDKEFADFKHQFGEYVHFRDFLSWKMYPKVWEEFNQHFEQFGAVRNLPTAAFFYGLSFNEEILVEIDKGKSILIQYLNLSEPNASGMRTVFFRLNGQTRSVDVRDHKIKVTVAAHEKAKGEKQIGTPLQGSLSKILVKEGQEIAANDPLFIIEAMKMESTITASVAGKVKKIVLGVKTLVQQNDLIIEME